MKRIVFGLAVIIGLNGCNENDPKTEVSDDFDRSAMLINWADNIIIPAYQDYTTKLAVLQTTTDAFTTNPNLNNLLDVRTAWSNAYISWQYVSLFEIGKAEEIALRNYTNIYPADVAGIESNIAEGTYNLELSSKYDEQGLPALDYLLNGIGATDEEIISFYTNTNYQTYLNDVVNRMIELSTLVYTDWQESYRDEFVANDGSSATSSVNKMVNDYIFYYERYLRAGKIGIPAGVFSSSTLSASVEGYYKDDISKQLFLASLDATKDFFNGKHYGSSTTGESISSYLDYLNSIKEGTDLSHLINNQFEVTRAAAELLDDSFANQIETDNSAMLETYDQLQLNVVLLKVDMPQALNIRIDYVDADGD